jgi:hypothetical protein
MDANLELSYFQKELLISMGTVLVKFRGSTVILYFELLNMQKKVVRRILVAFCVVVIAGAVSSCKTHEVCPAYTKADTVEQSH